MKLAIILPSLLNVGPNRVAFDIIEGLDNDIQVKVFYLDEKDGKKIDFPCECVKLRVSNVIQLYNFDVIHSHMFRPDILNSLLPFYNGRKITTIHNIVETDLLYSHSPLVSNVFSRIWRFFWRGLNTCVVLTDVALRYYTEFGIHPSKLKIINNGVNIDKDDNNNKNLKVKNIIENISKSYTVIGTACLFNKRKGLEQVIKSLPSMSNCAFVILGDGPEKATLINLAKSLGVEDRLFVLGFVENARSYFNLFDIYIMPSREEGLALAMLEAAASKVTIVCSNIPVFKECFDSSEVSFFKLDNTKSLVEAIDLAISNKTQLSSNAFTKFNNKYTREIMTQKYVAQYILNN